MPVSSGIAVRDLLCTSMPRWRLTIGWSDFTHADQPDWNGIDAPASTNSGTAHTNDICVFPSSRQNCAKPVEAVFGEHSGVVKCAGRGARRQAAGRSLPCPNGRRWGMTRFLARRLLNYVVLLVLASFLT